MILNLQYKARSAEPAEYQGYVSVALLGTEMRTRALFLVRNQEVSLSYMRHPVASYMGTEGCNCF